MKIAKVYNYVFSWTSSEYKNENKLAKLSRNHFLTANKTLWEKTSLWLWAKTKTKLKPELQMNVVCNTCGRELGKMKSVNENYYKMLIMKTSKATPC